MEKDLDEIKNLKKMIREFFVTKPYYYTDEMIRFNQKQVIELLKSLGYGGIDANLLHNILRGKEDKHLRNILNSKNKKKEEEFSPKYFKYLKGPVNVLDIKFLISKYFYNQNNPSFSKEDLMELRRVICVLLKRKGYPSTQVKDEFLKEFLKGKYDDVSNLKYVQSQIEDQILADLKSAYLNRKESWENFRMAFETYFYPYIDVFSVSDEEMEKLVEEKIGKDEENVLR